MELGRQLVQERQNREAALATIGRMETTLSAVRQAGMALTLTLALQLIRMGPGAQC